MMACSSLKNRVFKTGSVPHPIIPSIGTSRPQTYKNWNDSSLQLACEAVRNGISLRQASEEYHIPKSTLHDHLSGKILPGSKSGQKYLTDEEELVTFLIGCSEIGYPRTRKNVICLVQRILEEKGKDINLSYGWWEGFKRRHPGISLRSAEELSQYRARACTRDVFRKYFDLLEETMEENDILLKPTQIFNCDETGMPLDPKPPKVVVPKGIKHPRTITTGNKGQITVLACCSAAGYVIPPFVIFDRKALKPEMYDGEVAGTMYGLSDSGWINSELFDNWFLHHFLPHAPSVRPLLLLMDGHSSHYNPAVIRKAAEEKVILFCLPPHSSHETQPLDKGPFGPLKVAWKESCQKFLSKNPGKFVTRFTFSKIFNEAWCYSMSMKNVQAGFRCTGIYPLNRNLLVPEEENETAQKTNLAQRTGLKFIPLCSPLKPRRSSGSSYQFSSEEEDKFEKRFEEGYDIDTDDRYNMWKQIYHSSEESTSTIDSSNTVNVTPTCIAVTPSNTSTFIDSAHPLNYGMYSNPPMNPYFPWYPYNYYNPPLPPVTEQYPGIPDHNLHFNIQDTISSQHKPAVLSKSTIVSKILQQDGPIMKLPNIPPKASGKVLTSIENMRIMEEKEMKKKELEQLKLERQEKGK